MRTTDLTFFLSLLKTGNLSQAAAQSAISQPRASQILQRLETELRCSLFSRRKNGLEPTDAARVFVPFAEQMLQAAEAGAEAARSTCDVETGVLRIGVSHTTSAFLVPKLAILLHQRHPEIQASITKALPDQLVRDLQDGKLDVCLCFRPPHIADLQWQVSFRADMVGISKRSDLSQPTSVKLAQFARLPLVLPSRHCSSRAVLDSELHKLGVKPNVKMEVDDSDALISMVKHGLASSIIPRTMLKPSKHLVVSSLTEPSIRVTGGILTRQKVSRTASTFTKFVQQQIELTLSREADPESVMTP